MKNGKPLMIFAAFAAMGCLAPWQHPMSLSMGGGGITGQTYALGLGQACEFSWPEDSIYEVNNDSPPSSRKLAAVSATSIWEVHPCDAGNLVQFTVTNRPMPLQLIPPGVTVRHISRARGRVNTSLEIYELLPGEVAPRQVGFMTRSTELPYRSSSALFTLRQDVHGFWTSL